MNLLKRTESFLLNYYWIFMIIFFAIFVLWRIISVGAQAFVSQFRNLGFSSWILIAVLALFVVFMFVFSKKFLKPYGSKKNKSNVYLAVIVLIIFSVLLFMTLYSLKDYRWIDEKRNLEEVQLVEKLGVNDYLNGYIRHNGLWTIKTNQSQNYADKYLKNYTPFPEINNYIIDQLEIYPPYDGVDYTREIHNPPLIFLYYRIFYMDSSPENSLVMGQLITGILYMLVIFFFVFKFTDSLQISFRMVVLATTVIQFMREFVLPNSDLVFSLFGAISIFLIYGLVKKKIKSSFWMYFLTGLSMSVAILMKFSAIFVSLILIITLVIFQFNQFRSEFKKKILHFMMLFSGILLPLFFLFVFYDYNIMLNLIVGNIAQNEFVLAYTHNDAFFKFTRFFLSILEISINLGFLVLYAGLIALFNNWRKIKPELVLAAFYVVNFLIFYLLTPGRSVAAAVFMTFPLLAVGLRRMPAKAFYLIVLFNIAQVIIWNVSYLGYEAFGL